MATRSIGVRLPDDLVARIETHETRLREAHPGLGITKTDAVQDLLLRGLHAVPKRGRLRAFELPQPADGPTPQPEAGKR